MTSIPPTVYAPLIGLAGGIIGYAIREYKNRVRPLFQITTIDGATIKRSDSIVIPQEICDRLEGSFFLGELSPESNLGAGYDCWDKCDDLKKLWPETKTAIEKIINANTDDEFKHALGAAFGLRSFDQWLLKLLLNNKLDFQITEDIEQREEQIPAWIEKDDEEVVWFDLLPQAKSFGQKMSHPAIQAKCSPLIIAISRFHKAGIINALNEFKKIFEADYNKALSCINELNNITNEVSRWAFYCFFANTSNMPVVVQKDGFITINDSGTHTEFCEDCYLTLVDEKSLSWASVNFADKQRGTPIEKS